MSDTKHGWVTPRADGARARCGGPAVCSTCQTEQMHETMLNGVFGRPVNNAAEPKPETAGTAQDTPRPSWLDGGADAVAMAREDGLLPAASAVSMNTNNGWLDIDQQRLALWQAIQEIKIGNLHDDKVIIANLHRAGYVIAAAPGTPAETPSYTVTVDPDPRGVSVGVYQGSSCVYHGAHPIPAGAVADEGAKDERQAFEAWGMAGCEMVDDPQSGRLDIARHCAWEAWKARAAAAPAAGDARGSVDVLPDGSAFALASFPLPANHWLYAEREYAPGAEDPKELPAPILTHAQRDAVVAAIRYAVRGATMCGKEPDFDPDALVQNAVYALCGPFGIAIAASQQGGE